MKLIYDLLKTTSPTEKVKILAKADSLSLEAFYYAYNMYNNYGMTFSDDEVNIFQLGDMSLALRNLLSEILTKKRFGSAAKEAVVQFSRTHGDLIKLIINKDLRCGVSTTLLNKARPNFVPTFNVQLAKEVPLTQLKYPVLAQIKYDGVRLIIVNKERTVKFFTRNGKEVKLPMLNEMLAKANAINYVLDGEITVGKGLNADRTSVSGMINSAIHGGTIDETILRFHAFDILGLHEWEQNICENTYDVRYGMLVNLVRDWIGSDYIFLAPTNKAMTSQAVEELYETAIKDGYEGLILKREDHLYTFKRSKDWVKLKEIKTADLTCIDTLPGTGKYESIIGALVCTGTVDGVSVTVNVGSGLTDLDRSMPESDYIGRTIEVKYNGVIQDSVTGRMSLFLPRFVSVRFDK